MSEEKKTSDFKLIWPDGHNVELADITYKAFEEHLFETGSSDVEYDRYLMDRKQDELVDFTESTLKEAILIYKSGDRIIKFKVIEDLDNG